MRYYLDEGALLRRTGAGEPFDVWRPKANRWERYNPGESNPFVSAYEISEEESARITGMESGLSPEQTGVAAFTRGLNRQEETEPQPQGWSWLKLPEATETVLRQWQPYLTGDGEQVDDLHVTLLWGLLHPDQQDMLAELIQSALPMTLAFGPIRVFQLEDRNAIVVEVFSGQLEDLHETLQKRVGHVISRHQCRPHVTLGYVGRTDGLEADGLEIPALTQETCLVTEAGIKFDGRKEKSVSVTADDLSYMVQAEAYKALGMSTTSGESGGFLVDEPERPKKKKRSKPRDEDDDEDEEIESSWHDRVESLLEEFDRTYDL